MLVGFDQMFEFPLCRLSRSFKHPYSGLEQQRRFLHYNKRNSIGAKDKIIMDRIRAAPPTYVLVVLRAYSATECFLQPSD